jgi:hypothetical protein
MDNWTNYTFWENTMKNKRTIKICSNEYDLIFSKILTGGRFSTLGTETKDTGRGQLVVGTKFPDIRYRASVLIHEILEAILAVDCKRSSHQQNGEERHIFVFDHDYMDTLGEKVLDAMLTSECFIIDKNKLK